MAVLLIVFGVFAHPIEEAGTAERDGFVAQAETLLSGEIPRDPYRPLLYPLLTAGLAALGLAPFAAARLLSNLAAALLARAAYALGERLDPGPNAGVSVSGAWAMALTAANPNLWILGQHTTTDMVFGAVATGLLVVLLDYTRAPSHQRAAALGALYGVAAFLRGNALFLVPGIVLALVLAPVPWRRRLAHAALAAGVAALVLVPHFTLRQASFGDPFHDENWKNLAWKLYGEGDWSYLDRVPFANLGAVVAADPARMVAGGVGELARFARSGASQLFGTPLHAGFALAGLGALCAWGRRREAGLLAVAAGVFLGGLALVFFTWGRFLLVLLPLGMAFGAAGTAVLVERSGGSRRLRWAATAALAGALVILTAKTALFQLPAFLRRHPVGELAVLTELTAAHPGVTLAGTAPFLGRRLPSPYFPLPDAFGPEIQEPARYWTRLEPQLRARDVRFLVVSALELRDRPRGLLGAEAPVPWLEKVGEGGETVAWAVKPSSTAGVR